MKIFNNNFDCKNIQQKKVLFSSHPTTILVISQLQSSIKTKYFSSNIYSLDYNDIIALSTV